MVRELNLNLKSKFKMTFTALLNNFGLFGLKI